MEAGNIFLTGEATDEEIYQTVNQVSPLNALGLNGMHALFYQKRWHIHGRKLFIF